MVDTKLATIQDIVSEMKKKNRRADTKLVMKAYEFAKEKHGDQKRKSGEPYIIHPVQVAYILASLELDESTICAALLHDILEDTETTKKEVVTEFSEEIYDMVDGVTKLGKLNYTSQEEQQVENYRKMFLAMGKDIRVILIKLADRLHNMRTLKFLTRDRQIANARETMDLYAPLANRLGMYSLKWELEDLAFKYLYPEEFREIVEGIDKKREERLEFINMIMDELHIQLKKQRIEAEITGRAKHLYSIYRKMKRDNKTLDQIYDLFALRIIVNSVKDCYAALGIVHDLYNPMPGRFKDYISVPKPNMYQSLHTTLIGPKGTPFEVQIRTWDMHRIAEFGIAAHWAYKEANKTKKSNVTVAEDKLAWLRETLEWQKDMQDPQEFLNTLKTELFEDEVYVFTPRGEIKVLPRGATPIDFAYNIHAEIGHHMTGCKINSKMMPIVTALKSGDIVEIITSDQAKGPSRDWLKFVKSSSAKTKIQQWYKKNEREANIEKGKDLIEKEIKRVGMNYDQIFKTEFVQVALDRYKYTSVEDMYASVGFGAMTASKIIARILEEYRKEHKEENVDKTLEELSKEKIGVRTKASHTGVVVEGIDNCLVKLSKCCNPVPGDEIVGYITRGRGVSIHRKSCLNVTDLVTSEEARMIDVYWANQEKSAYQVEIEIFANDRSGLLADIINMISATKSKMLAVSSRANREKIAITELTIEIENVEALNNVIKSLRKIDSVYEVKRKK